LLNGLVNGQASKFLVGVLGAVSSGLATYYSTARWEPVVVMALTAIGIYLIPNKPAP
jgi:hypothetical protein